MERFIPIIVAVLLVTPALASEGIVNGGFESGSVDPWTFDFDWSVSTTNPYSGTYCALGVDFHYIHQTFTPIPVDDINSITVWVRQPEAFQFRTRLYYGASDWDEPGTIDISDNTWNQIDLTTYIRTSGALEGVRFFSYNGGGPNPNHTYIDDISVNYGGGSAVESASLGELKVAFR